MPAWPEMTKETSTDILGLGSVAVDDLVYVESYPPANAKVRVLDRERQCGGLTATALVAAANLGCRCSYAGVTGTDEASEFALASLGRAGVAVDLASRRPGARVFHSTIVVDRAGRRTLMCDGRNVQGAAADWPGEDVVRSCRVLFVDHVGMAGMVRAARIARAAGIPIVADIERAESEYFGELMTLAGHVIVPEEFAFEATGRKQPGEAAAALRREEHQVVVVTCGERGAWHVGRGCPPAHQEAYRVQVVDTTGCGDVFHGAYAAGLVMGLDAAGRLRLASAAAALKATRRGGQAGCPTLAEVRSFLESRDL
jgi:sugar/nucleoside kinase (ribokinase family)